MSDSEKRSAQLVMVTGFVALYLIFKLNAFIFIALGIGAGSLASSLFGDFIVKVWFKIAHVLGWINTRILLSILFYAFLFPIAIFSRLFNKDALKMKIKKRPSIYVERNHQYSGKDLENTW